MSSNLRVGILLYQRQKMYVVMAISQTDKLDFKGKRYSFQLQLRYYTHTVTMIQFFFQVLTCFLKTAQIIILRGNKTVVSCIYSNRSDFLQDFEVRKIGILFAAFNRIYLGCAKKIQKLSSYLMGVICLHIPQGIVRKHVGGVTAVQFFSV